MNQGMRPMARANWEPSIIHDLCLRNALQHVVAESDLLSKSQIYPFAHDAKHGIFVAKAFFCKGQ